jgi:dimethylhistidine N-methyltransferase
LFTGKIVTSIAAVFDVPELSSSIHAVACESRDGLTRQPKCLSPWLFYDEAGSNLFEQITTLPEYYLTRTERSLFEAHSGDILRRMGAAAETWLRENQPLHLRYPLTIAELGAGTATKTGILLRELARLQRRVIYQPIDVSVSALEHARRLESEIAGLSVQPCVANYVAEPYRIERPRRSRVLALYIGSSIGNFAPPDARSILQRLRQQLRPGDGLLLGTDAAPGPHKSIATLCAAYDDAQGVTAAFNRNILVRLNRELGANFRPENFAHVAVWNSAESRIEMHLRSITVQAVTIPANSAGPALVVKFRPGETIHTENSYKFTGQRVSDLLASAGFVTAQIFKDQKELFSLTLAIAQ